MQPRDRADELAEDLARIEAAIERGAEQTRLAIESLAGRIETTYVRKDVYEARHNTVLDRVAKVEGSLTWTARTAVTALLLPILVAIVVTVIIAGGGR